MVQAKVREGIPRERSEMEKLVPEWGWQRDKGSWFHSKDKVKLNEGSDQLFLERMMKVAEHEWRWMKSEYCDDVEWRWGYECMEVR